MRKYIFNRSWYGFLSLYFILYLISFSGLLKVADEYEGGDKMAEFFAGLFSTVMIFPMNLASFFQVEMNSKQNLLWVILFIVSSLFSCFTVTTVLNFLYLRVAAILKSLY